MKMLILRHWRWFFLICICVVSAGIGCLAMLKAGRGGGEKADFQEAGMLSEGERNKVYYDYMAASAASMIERSDLISDCELHISYTDSEITGISVKLGVSSENAGNNVLTPEGRDDILRYISTVFEFPAESIVLSVI